MAIYIDIQEFRVNTAVAQNGMNHWTTVIPIITVKESLIDGDMQS